MCAFVREAGLHPVDCLTADFEGMTGSSRLVASGDAVTDTGYVAV